RAAIQARERHVRRLREGRRTGECGGASAGGEHDQAAMHVFAPWQSATNAFAELGFTRARSLNGWSGCCRLLALRSTRIKFFARRNKSSHRCALQADVGRIEAVARP